MKLLIALLSGVLLYFVQLYLYRYLWKEGLNVSIGFKNSIVREDGENELIEIISNDKFLPLPVIQVKFAITRTFEFKRRDNSAVTDHYYRNDFFSLSPYRKITRIYGFKCRKRGFYSLNGLDIICKDLFLTGKMLKSLKPEASVCVLPRRLKPDEIPASVKDFIGEIVDNVKRNEDPFEFAGIREYQPYDPMNRINWKAGAASQRLMVNRYDTTVMRRVVIYLNAECHIKWHEEDFVEEEIRLAASLTDRFIRDHIPVAMYSNGCDCISGEVLRVEAGADAAHLANIERSLARLDSKVIKGDFVQLFSELMEDKRYDGTECVIISNYRKQDLVDAYDKLKDKGIGVSWIIPEYSSMDPALMKRGDDHIFKWTVRYAG